jgi:hypothetical protein
MTQINADVLNNCVDVCRTNNKKSAAYLACLTGCENTFMTGTGNTMTPDGKGGKVFSDTIGGKVFIDAQGGKVFSPPPAAPATLVGQ